MKSFSYHVLSAIGAGAMVAILWRVGHQVAEAPKGVAPVVEAGMKVGWKRTTASKDQPFAIHFDRGTDFSTWPSNPSL